MPYTNPQLFETNYTLNNYSISKQIVKVSSQVVVNLDRFRTKQISNNHTF